jgi:hypothetical protein
MIRALILLVLSAAVSASVPKPPILCVDVPELDSSFCPGQDVRMIFTQREGCEEPKLAFHNCANPPAEDPNDFAPEPLHCDAPGADPSFCIEAGYDEHGPGPIDDGAPGAPTVDHPEP